MEMSKTTYLAARIAVAVMAACALLACVQVGRAFAGMEQGEPVVCDVEVIDAASGIDDQDAQQWDASLSGHAIWFS